MTTFQAVCETCGELKTPRATKALAYHDAREHLQTPGYEDHIVDVITTQNDVRIATERVELDQV